MENQKKINNKLLIQKFIYIFIKFIILLVIYLLFFKVIFNVKRVDTNNMSPSIKPGDLLFINKLDKDYHVGDVVLVNHNEKKYFFRIVASSNQKVEIDDSGIVLVDDALEGYKTMYKTFKDLNSDINYPYTVLDSSFFLLNDNRDVDNDSRVFGSINKDDIIGKVVAKLQIRNF